MTPEEKGKLDGLYEESRARFKTSFYWDSMVLAVRDTVVALEARVAGVTFEQAIAAFEERRKKKEQALLEKAEDISPELAADADDRTPPELPESP